MMRFVSYFVKNIEVDGAIKGCVESAVKSYSQAFGSKARLAKVCDCFSRRKFSFFDPVH